MRKYILSIAFMSLSLTAFTQVNSIGPSAGFNYAWLSNNSDGDGRPSFNIGLLFNHSILESSGIGFGLRYSQEGSTVKIGNRTFTNALNYVRIPVTFSYYFGQLEEDFRPKIFVGPSFAFLVGGESKTLLGETVVTVNSKDVYEAFDLGVQAGAGFNYRLAKLTWLNFDLAYTHGFLNVAGKSNSNESQNRLFNVNLGVAFGF